MSTLRDPHSWSTAHSNAELESAETFEILFGTLCVCMVTNPPHPPSPSEKLHRLHHTHTGSTYTELALTLFCVRILCFCACFCLLFFCAVQTYPPTNKKVVSDVDLCTCSFDDDGLIRSYTYGLMVELVFAVEDLVCLFTAS